jgi:NAD(P)H-nitrite reductase large subunit
MADPEGAIIQRDGKTYAVVTRSPAGVVTPEHLEKVARIARKYRIPTIKITAGQRIALIGIAPGDVAGVRADLGTDTEQTGGPCVKYVQACPGNDTCRHGIADSIGIAKTLAEKYAGSTFPAKIKIGVSGCPRSCGESHIRDIGLLATAKGWTVLFGGNGALNPDSGIWLQRICLPGKRSILWIACSLITRSTQNRMNGLPGTWNVPVWTP